MIEIGIPDDRITISREPNSSWIKHHPDDDLVKMCEKLTGFLEFKIPRTSPMSKFSYVAVFDNPQDAVMFKLAL